jgi:DHA1 family bicyclomycin/chloramphenicol resistance-like MFS transporter
LGGSAAWVGAVAMVRDFFPVEHSARVFSLLFLIIGVSPLAAPTIGGFIVTTLGWQAIFIGLIIVTLLFLFFVFFFLPEGHQPDPTISLEIKPMLLTFRDILKDPGFNKFAIAGSFSFCTLFVYVAGSPIIFMEMYHVSPKMYGAIFALLSVGFIGGGQINIQLMKKFTSEKIFRSALIAQVMASVVFLLGVASGWFGLYEIITMFFICLSCLGLINPNANALALAPFTRTIGSASALLGFIQIGLASIASAGAGLFNAISAVPSVLLMTVTSGLALLIFVGAENRKLKAKS